MLYVYVNEELVMTTSNHNKKWRILLKYRKKAKEEKKTYIVRVVETRNTIYM